MSSLVETVRSFRRLRALVIGDAMLDTYLEGTADRLCTEGPVPVVRRMAEHRAAGGAANAAANLRALGASVALLGVTGKDAAGTTLRSIVRAQGIDTTGLIAGAHTTTNHKLRILADGQYVVRYDEGGELTHGPDVRAALLARLEELLPACDLIVVSDYRYGVLSDALLARLRALRARHPVPLLVDSKQPRRFARLRATVITPNALEAGRLLEAEGVTLPDAREPVPRRGEHLARLLLERIDAEYAAVTLAGDGVVVAGRDGSATHVPAYPVAQANDVGAGDSFTAALGLALAAGAEMADAARIAIDAASIAVTRRFTAVVSQRDLLRRVSLREHASDGRGAFAGEMNTRKARRLLAERLELERTAGRTVVFTNGVFDILHAGHVEFLRRARALGDVLVVGVNSDRGARRLKGAYRPINSERDRLALVSALDAVDHALLFDEETPTALIRALRPQIHVKGGDYAGETLPEEETVRAGGGRVVILPLAGSLSTSEVIGRIVRLARAGTGTATGTATGTGADA